MDSGLETAGALATATAAATILDPPASQVEGHGACLNCEAPLSGAYCSNCGQKAHLHRSILHAVEEFLHGILHFDSKLWHTLPLLLFRPGKLTWDYVHGHRARFISPVALFLLTVFTMFFVFGFLGSASAPDGMTVVTDPVRKAKALATANTGIAEMDREIREIGTDPARAADLAALKVTRATAVQARDALLAEKDGGTPAMANQSVGEAITSAIKSNGLKLETGEGKLNEKLRAALNNPEFVFYKMQQKGYKLSFLLVPLSLPWMWLLFAWKRDVKAYDHVVFLLYSISFMSLLFMAGALCAAAGVTEPIVYALLFTLIPIVHIYAQLKGGYRLSGFSAAWRTSVLSLLAFTTLVTYFTGILLLGLLD
ncbi:DUF3667 domain-containing protein [Sandaracinobacteroides hominis]|uniref:DUF3667 domain-containing protein n=1 Tax=Sandaracinobacteroides hominis TaxID=2780086 RepID=UPI0018F3A915|nr:DUF3667 domain-containing protein [Sandaracinobacteroides hominis]